MIQTHNLTKTYKNFTAVDSISLHIAPGETLGLIGESGSGKSTLGRLLLHLILPTSGSVSFNGALLSSFSPSQLKQWRQKAQIVFQDPYASLNPRMKVSAILAEPLQIHRLPSSPSLLSHALLEVDLSPDKLSSYPHQLSGGERQRVCIARALISKPTFLVCDEPTASLDMATASQIISLLNHLKTHHNLTLLFISHDIRLIKSIATTTAVMRHGRILEYAPTATLLSSPQHSYTQALLAASPI